MRPPRALLGTPNRWGAIDKADPEALIVQAQGRRPKSQSGGVGLAAGASDQNPKAKQAVEPAVASETNLRKPWLRDESRGTNKPETNLKGLDAGTA